MLVTLFIVCIAFILLGSLWDWLDRRRTRKALDDLTWQVERLREEVHRRKK